MAFNAKSANALSFRDTIMTALDMRYTMYSQEVTENKRAAGRYSYWKDKRGSQARASSLGNTAPPRPRSFRGHLILNNRHHLVRWLIKQLNCVLHRICSINTACPESPFLVHYFRHNDCMSSSLGDLQTTDCCGIHVVHLFGESAIFAIDACLSLWTGLSTAREWATMSIDAFGI
jgi:hypothetical protein